jgi:glycosyltransferase involved in cell wall biosynthesis
MTLKNELVSIILPTYNRVDLLKNAVDSVLVQTYENFELIIVDDGSSDETLSFVKSLKDERIKLISQENMGRSRARNNGLQVAAGSLITFIDSDDLYMPRKIELQVNFLNSQDKFDFVYTSADCFMGNTTEVPVHRYLASASGDIYEEIAAYVPLTICLPTVMFRRKVLDNVGLFDTNLDRFEDTDYWRRVSQKFKMGAIEEITCLIRTHEGNAIDGLSAQVLRRQVLKYGKKILAEDLENHGYVIFSLVSNMYRHYAWAISSNSLGNIDGFLLFFKSEWLHKRYLYQKEIADGSNLGQISLAMARSLTSRLALSMKLLLIRLLGQKVTGIVVLLKSRVKKLLRR